MSIPLIILYIFYQVSPRPPTLQRKQFEDVQPLLTANRSSSRKHPVNLFSKALIHFPYGATRTAHKSSIKLPLVLTASTNYMMICILSFNMHIIGLSYHFIYGLPLSERYGLGPYDLPYIDTVYGLAIHCILSPYILPSINTSHLPGLNLICHLSAHICKESIFHCILR